jgi:hypothetical protein
MATIGASCAHCSITVALHFPAGQKSYTPTVAVAALTAGTPLQLPSATGPRFDNFVERCSAFFFLLRAEKY